MALHRRKLAFLAAATIGVVLAVLPSGSPAPSAAPLPVDDGSDGSLRITTCGDSIDVLASIHAGTTLTIGIWTDDPPGSHDAEIAQFMSAQGGWITYFWEAVRQYFCGTDWSNYVCAPCTAGYYACSMGIKQTLTDPADIKVHHYIEKVGSYIVAKVTINETFDAQGWCTPCEQ